MFNPLPSGVHRKVIHTWKALQHWAGSLFKYVSFFGIPGSKVLILLHFLSSSCKWDNLLNWHEITVLIVLNRQILSNIYYISAKANTFKQKQLLWTSQLTLTHFMSMFHLYTHSFIQQTYTNIYKIKSHNHQKLSVTTGIINTYKVIWKSKQYIIIIIVKIVITVQ